MSRSWSASLLLSAMVAVPARAKSARTFYTEARMETVQANLAGYPWARDLQRSYLAEAESWARRDDAFLRAMVIPPQVPRCYDVH